VLITSLWFLVVRIRLTYVCCLSSTVCSFALCAVRQKLADAEATLNVRQEELNQLTVQKETARLEAEQRFGSLRRVLFGGSSCSTPVLCC